MKPGFDLDELELRHATGWTFVSSKITDEFRWSDFIASRPEGTVPILWINPSSELRFVSTQANPQPSVGSHVISFGPKPEREQKPAQGDGEKPTP